MLQSYIMAHEGSSRPLTAKFRFPFYVRTISISVGQGAKVHVFIRVHPLHSVSILLCMALYVIRGLVYARTRIRPQLSPSGFVMASWALRQVCFRVRRSSTARIVVSILLILLNVLLLVPDAEII